MPPAVNTVSDGITKDSSLILEGAGDLEIDGVKMGTFQGGLVLTHGHETVYIKSDYHMGNLRAVKRGTSMTLSTELEQAGLENLAIAYGIPSSSVLSGVSSKIVQLVPVLPMLEHSVIFYGMSATNNALKRTVTLNRVCRVGATGTTFYRGQKLVLPVSFECLINSSGSYGQIVDTTV